MQKDAAALWYTTWGSFLYSSSLCHQFVGPPFLKWTSSLTFIKHFVKVFIWMREPLHIKWGYALYVIGQVDNSILISYLLSKVWILPPDQLTLEVLSMQTCFVQLKEVGHNLFTQVMKTFCWMHFGNKYLRTLFNHNRRNIENTMLFTW